MTTIITNNATAPHSLRTRTAQVRRAINGFETVPGTVMVKGLPAFNVVLVVAPSFEDPADMVAVIETRIAWARADVMDNGNIIVGAI